MSLYIYAPTLYPGTKELIDILQAKRLVKHDGMHFLRKGVPIEFSATDAIVCWGGHAPVVEHVRCLNANNSFRNMLDVNVNGYKRLSQAGYSVFQFTEVNDKTYAQGLAMVKPGNFWWPKVAPDSGFVSIPEAWGYGISYHRLDRVVTATVFKDAILTETTPEVAALARKLLSLLGLDFGELHIGTYRGMTFLLKVVTAPLLDTEGVKLFAKHISAWSNDV